MAMEEVPGETFQNLVKEWEEWQKTVMHCSMPMERTSPLWPKTIEMGMPIVPFILKELQRKPAWWMLQVLREITKADPFPRRHAGNYPKMIEGWVRWGKENGYLSTR